MKNAAKTKSLGICMALAALMAFSACTGEGSYTAAPELETQTTSLSEAMRAMDECRPILEENFDADGNVDPDLTRERYGQCLDENGVVPPLDPLRICSVISERVNFALERHQVNCGAPADLLEATLCDVADYVSNCDEVVPPPTEQCFEADCDRDGREGPGAGTDFCSDVRQTVDECIDRDQPTTLPQQFPECFDADGDMNRPDEDPNHDRPGEEGADGSTDPDGQDREGGSGWGGQSGEEGGEDGIGEGAGWGGTESGEEGRDGSEDPNGQNSAGWGDDGASQEACAVLQDEIDNCMDAETCASLEDLRDEHCK